MEIEELLQSEKEDLADLRTLKAKLTDPEHLRIVSDLLARKTERVITLSELYQYRDPKDDAHANGAEK